MAGPFLQIALEEVPNGEHIEDGVHIPDTNDVSSDVFYPRLLKFEDVDGAKMLEEKDLIAGSLSSPPHRGVGSYDPTPKLVEIHPRMGDMPVLLAATCGIATPTVGDGSAVVDPDAHAIPIGATKYVIGFKDTEPPQACQITARTGDGKFRRATGAAIAELAAKFLDDGALTLEATMLALVLDDLADPSIVPVYDDAYPLGRGDMSVSWLANSARTTDFDFAITSPVEAKHENLVASLFPSLLQFVNNGEPGISGTIAKAALADADVAALLNGTQFEATIKIVGRETIKRAAVAITSSSVASASVITCAAPHHLPAGTSSVLIAGHSGSTPDINGTHVATKIDGTTFSIPVNVATGGTDGTVVSDTEYYPTMWIEMPGCMLVSLDRDAIAKERRREGKWNWEARNDNVTAKLADITVVVDVDAIATYA